MTTPAAASGLPPGGFADDPTGPVGPLPPAVPPVPPLGRGRADRPSLGWAELGVAAAVYLEAQLVLGGLLVVAYGFSRGGSAAVLGGSSAASLPPASLPPAPLLVAVSAVAAFAAAGTAVAIRAGATVALGLRRVSWRVVLAAIGIGIGVWAASRIVILAYVEITGDISDPQEELRFAGPVAAALMLVLAGVVVPCGEELLFRGVLFGALRRYGFVIAAATSGLVFGLAHGLNAVLPAAALLGVVNCLLYERTRSVVPGMLVHILFNLLSLVLFLVLG